MAKQLNQVHVNLAFNADTGKAKAQIQELQASLNALSSGAGINKDLPITGEIMEAQVAAKQLSLALNEAFNADTGKLDLSKFSKSLSDSKMTLTDYSNKLSLLGREGDQAFLKLAHSIVSTEAPLKRTSTLLTDMGTTLKNTVRWQLSSTMLHGFMSTMSSAYRYAQDLNQSLNNIRIVTGQSSEQMAEFAKHANKAAKELSTTTTAYTNAALIYYQQGDDDATVLEKTDVTAKMANVTGTSAEVVSDQLTAIWNNFNKSGEESYERYADILTALGAATASSTDEIAGGLEKFAGVADAIGLSYEYAASALATITATTRMSEDVVGTALKTMFARIQGLNLGETLEDGTTLNKYSNALASVGISIKDTSGELKDMDTILSEMGAKWSTISKDQQVALAQAVAGVRQYTQLVALMDNWDFMEENLQTSYDAEGTLQEQADIYAESWEAASNRVQASFETIIGALIKDDFFIGLTDGFATALEGVDGLIDGLGGLKGVIFLIGTILTSVFQEQMTNGINNALYNFSRFTGVAQADMQALKDEAYKTAMAMTRDMDGPGVEALRDKLQNVYEIQERLRESIKNMSPEQAEAAKNALKLYEHYADAAIEAAKVAEKAQETAEKTRQAASNKHGSGFQTSIELNNDTAFGSSGGALTSTAANMINQFKQLGINTDTVTAQLREYQAALHSGSEEEATEKAKILTDTLNQLTQSARTNTEGFEAFQAEAYKVATGVVNIQSDFENLRGSLDAKPLDANSAKELEEIVTQAQNAGIAIREELIAALNKYKAAMDGDDEEAQKQALKELETQFRLTGISAEKAAEAIAKQAAAESGLKEGDITPAMKEAAGAARQYAVEVTGFTNAEEKARLEAEKAKKALEQQGLAYKTLGSAITGTVQGFSSLAMAVSSIMSLKDTLSDESLSGAEKTLRIITSFGMILPMLISGLTAFGNAWKFATSKDITEGLTAQIAKLFGVEVATVKVTSATDANTIATEVNTKETWKNVAAKIAQHWWILAIAGGIAVLAGALKIADRLYNADAIAAEKAAEASKQASEAFAEAESAYKEFESHLTEYTEGVKGLQDLEEGTLAYREALLKANDAALQLIDTANLQMGTDYDIVNGVIQISEEALEKAKEAQLLEMERAQAYKIYARQEAKTAALKQKETEFNREHAKGLGSSKETDAASVATLGMIGGGALLGLGTAAGLAKMGAAIGTAITPGIGTAIGAALGVIAGIGVSIAADLNKSTEEESRALRVLQAEYEKVGSNSVFTAEEIRRILGEHGGFSDQLINSLADANIETEKMVMALADNTAAIRASIEQSAAGANADNAEYQALNEDQQNFADKLIAREAGKIIANPEGEEYKELENKQRLAFNQNQTAAYQKYLVARYGADQVGNYQITNTGGNNVTLQRKNADGTWENVGNKNGLSKEDIITFLTHNEAKQYSAEKYADEIKAIETTGEIFGRVSTKDANGNSVLGIDEDAIKSIQNNLAAGEEVDLSVLSPEQVNALRDELVAAGGEISQAHAEAIAKAAEKYDPQAFKDRMDAEAENVLTEGAASLDMDTAALEAYTDQLMANNEALADNKKIAAEVAVESARFSIGLDKLEKAVSDNIKTIRKADKSNLDYYESVGAVQTALEDAFGVDVDSDFITENLEKIEAAATGDEEAVNALRDALSKDIICEVLGVSKFEQVNTDLQNLATDISDMSTEVQVGAVLNDGDFLAKAQEMVSTAGMTVEQAQSYFNSLGYEPEFVTEEQTVRTEVPQERTHTDYEITEGSIRVGSVDLPYPTIDRISTTSIDGYVPVDQKIQVPAIGDDGPKIKSLKKTGATLPMGSSKSGGNKNSGSKSKGSKGAGKVKASDAVERYKEINDQLDNLKDSAEDLNKETNRLYGKDKLNAMKKQNALILEEQKLLKKKREEAKRNLETDRDALTLAAQAAGVKLDIKDDEIINYTSVLTDLYEDLEKLTDEAGDAATEAQQTAIDELKEKIDTLEKAIATFDGTRELIEDLDNEIQDKFYEWQDNNYETLKYALELKVEINDAELEKLDYFLDKYSDSFYKMAESAALMSDKIDPTIQKLEDYKGHKESLDESYRKGEISQEAYYEGLKEVREGYYDNLQSLIELDKAMMHYYGDTLDAASEELSTFTDHMQHLTGVFDHYTSLMEILGKQKDYNAMGNFLGGKADTIKDRLDVAKEYYEMLKENSKADEYWANYQAALAAGNEDMAQWWKEQWDVEVDALDAAQEEMLGLTEEWAGAMKAVIENNMNKISDTLEKALTGGLGFDKLMDDFDKLNTRQEEYLTKTNQLYETNKLMRTANKALDETDNQAAKLKLKNFIDETKSLQENTQLSKYELEIQQAKYDLLLAEIALEEAQNAKATVRLSRDNEGNFGYVYTADQDAISDAQQQLDDAENSLYNKSLEGQQNYTEKYLQAQQEMFGQLDELWNLYYEEGAITKEQYEQRYAELQNHYYGEGGVLSTYAHLYNIGVQTDANATADNWLKNYGAMTQNTADWQSAIDTYYTAVQGQITSWEGVATTANSNVSGALNNSATATKNLTDESEVLRDKIVNGIIPAIDDELEAVQNQTNAYATQRDTLLELIKTYEQYIDQLNSQVTAASVDFDKDTDYSELMNEYLNSGGKVGDATYNELLRQRNAKIDWLESQGYDESYWGTRGDATTALYNDLVARKGDQEWFRKDYMSDEKLKEAFTTLDIPLGALEEKLNKVAENVDKVAVATDEVAKSNTSVGEAVTSVGEAVTTSNTETKDALTTNLDTINNTMQKSTEDTVVTLETMTGDISNAIETMTHEITSALDTLSSDISNSLDRVSQEVSDVASAIGGINFGVSGLAGFASGGYTGDWGPQGKLAMLHEKELVLNAADTENLLSTIGLVREISNMIDIQASGASLFNLMATSGLTTANEVLEQNVTIHAEFPNATNHSEIEEAFNNLVNKASQYANRK